MPWDLVIVHPNGHRLGRPNEVKAMLARAWPQVQWQILPPLLERIKNQPDNPFHALIPTWSAEMRQRAALPRTVGALEEELCSFEIFGIDEDPVQNLDVEVRGRGNPIPTLLRLQSLLRWSIRELATGRFLDEREAQNRWTEFTKNQDAAIDQAKQ